MRLTLKLLIGAGLSLMTAACDNSNNSSSTPAASQMHTAAPSPAAQISSQFATFFNASATSVPAEPTASDVPAVSLTTDPIAAH